MYCPNCATRLTKAFEVCPHCKKILNIKLLEQVYFSRNSSKLNKRILNKIWLKEHGHIIKPVLMLIVGIALGTIASYGYADFQYRGAMSDFETKIADLQTMIDVNKSASGEVKSEFKEQLESKDEIITILFEQKNILAKIINLTGRFTTNLVLPDSSDSANYFSQNVKSLIAQFNLQQAKLNGTGFDKDKTFDLKTIPQLLE